jgi:nitroreductase
MQTNPPSTQDEAQAIHDGLAEAAASAGYAPSIHNTQPWRWRLGPKSLDLYLERSRIVAVTDPDTRLATLSCGAALHHARTTLGAEGWHISVARMPDAADQDHLAQVRVQQLGRADPEAVRHVRTIPLRHTNRRPVRGARINPEDLRAITASVQAEGGRLHMLPPDQILDLAAAAGQALRTEAGEPEWRAELAYWTGGAQPTGTGITAQHDRAALFAILHGPSDEPRDWLRAGEALSAGWLTATERGISVLPLSAPVEVSGTRDAMRRILSYLSHPFLVIRFGTVDPADADTQHTPRLPASQTIDRR